MGRSDSSITGHGISLVRVDGEFLRNSGGKLKRTNPVEAKAVVDGAPKAVLEGANKEAAEKAKAALEEAGATITLFLNSTPIDSVVTGANGAFACYHRGSGNTVTIRAEGTYRNERFD